MLVTRKPNLWQGRDVESAELCASGPHPGPYYLACWIVVLDGKKQYRRYRVYSVSNRFLLGSLLFHMRPGVASNARDYSGVPRRPLFTPVWLGCGLLPLQGQDTFLLHT